MKNLTLIIPARKEKESLPQVIDEIKNLDCKKKVILAPDDIDTINAIKNLNVDIIYQDHRGYGDALITGINNVDTDYFCIFNADGSFNPSELPGMLELIKNSTVFDQFITDAMQDYEQFTIEDKEQEIKNSKTSSSTT